MNTLTVKDLTKNYGEVKALSGVSLCFEKEKIYGLLGRNGAGKSTLINIMTNKLFACGGGVYIDGKSVTENDDVLQNICCMSEKTGYPFDTKLKKAFEYTNGFYPNFDIEYAYSLAEKFNLNLNKKIYQLSTGFNTMYKLILALASNADVCIYDEPVLGLDATVRDIFYKELLKNYSIRPKTIIISTHLIEEISNIAENMIVLRDGKVIEDCTTDELVSGYYKVIGSDSEVDSFCRGKQVVDWFTIGRLKTAVVKGIIEKVKPASVEISNMSLQEVFVHITKKENEYE